MYSRTTARRIAVLRSSSMCHLCLPGTRGYRVPSRARRSSAGASPLQAERGDEGLLGDLDAPDGLHPLLPLLLALQELAFAGDVAAVALGELVLSFGVH